MRILWKNIVRKGNSSRIGNELGRAYPITEVKTLKTIKYGMLIVSTPTEG